MTFNLTSLLKKLLVIFLIFAGLYFGKEIIMPLAVGAVFAMLFLPLCNWLERKKIPRGFSAAICLLILISALAGIATLLGWQIIELTKDVDLIKQGIINLGIETQQFIFNKIGMSLEKQSEVLSSQQPLVTKIIQDFASSLSNIFAYSILILFYLAFLLYYRSHLKNFILMLFPIEKRNEIKDVIYSVANVSQQYLLGLFKMIVYLWIMYSIGFTMLGVTNSFFFAFLCGLLEIIPFIGNITGTFITVMVAAVHGAGTPILLGIVITYGMVQFIQGWILEPLIVGSSVKINPLFTIIALLIGQLLWGVSGIFIAIPMMAMIKIVCDYVEPLKPYGYLIGKTEDSETDSNYLKKIKGWFVKKGQPTDQK